MRSSINNLWTTLPSVNLPRSKFLRPSAHKTTIGFDYLYPIFVDQVYPGDTYRLQTHLYARLTPTAIKVPLMDNIHLEIFYFFVPYRLLWNHWENFIGGNDATPDDEASTEYVMPTFLGTPIPHTVESFSLFDYLGVPVGVQMAQKVRTLWHRGYTLIWNEWFRSQDLQEKGYFTNDDGPDIMNNWPLRRRCRVHDYFSSCLDMPQQGESMSVPLGGEAPVFGTSYALGLEGNGDEIGNLYTLTGGTSLNADDSDFPNVMGASVISPSAMTGDRYMGVVNKSILDSEFPGDNDRYQYSGLKADLSEATFSGLTINDLRTAFQIQKILERDKRGGKRYVEQIASHWGVVLPDFRAQRPEFLGHGYTRMVISPIHQTSENGSGGSLLGQPAAVGTARMHYAGFTHSFVEHGFVIGLINARADVTYQQGLDRDFSLTTRFDFYMPETAMLGEQTVLNQEIFCNNDGNDALPFGYQERWAHLRYKNNRVSGMFRSGITGSLDSWHLADDYGISLPTLGGTWIQQETPISRVLQGDYDGDLRHCQIILDTYFDLTCVRRLPMRSIPGMVDHF